MPVDTLAPEETDTQTTSTVPLGDDVLADGAANPFDDDDCLTDPFAPEVQAHRRDEGARTPDETLPVASSQLIMGVAALIGTIVGVSLYGELEGRLMLATGLLATSCAFVAFRYLERRHLRALAERSAHASFQEPYVQSLIQRSQDSVREATLGELEKVRVFFESLLEKHVFRIHRDLRECEDELTELRRQNEALRSASPDAAEAAAPPPPPAVNPSPIEQQEWDAAVDPSDIVLRDLLKEVVDDVSDYPSLRGTRVWTRVPKTLESIRSDARRLRAALEQLVVIVSECSKGGITLSAHQRESAIEFKVRGKQPTTETLGSGQRTKLGEIGAVLSPLGAKLVQRNKSANAMLLALEIPLDR